MNIILAIIFLSSCALSSTSAKQEQLDPISDEVNSLVNKLLGPINAELANLNAQVTTINNELNSINVNGLNNFINSQVSSLNNAVVNFNQFKSMVSDREWLVQLFSNFQSALNSLNNCQITDPIVKYVQSNTRIQIYNSDLCRIQYIIAATKYKPLYNFVVSKIPSTALIELPNDPTGGMCTAFYYISKIFGVIADDVNDLTSSIDADLNIASGEVLAVVQIACGVIAAALRTAAVSFEIACFSLDYSFA